MGRPAKSRTLAVWMNGERVGYWRLQANGGQAFSYVDSWLESPAARPISLSMPLRPTSKAYTDNRVPAFFDNLLPDNRSVRERIQRRFRTESAEPFALLAEVGRDCVGALQFLAEDLEPTEIRQIRGQPVSDKDIEQLLADMLVAPMGQVEESEAFRISIAGAQEKTALLWHDGGWQQPLGSTPTTHILKLPIGVANQGIDLTTSVENEWLCAMVLKSYGIPTANCAMAQFGQRKVLVVERFDRKLAADESWLIRLPQEDLCQATATPPGLKYETDGGPGIRRCMELLLGSTMAREDRLDFLRTQVLFWMLCAIDGHAKNFSVFLAPGGGYRLTPRYDVLSAYPVLGFGANQLSPKKVRMAMAVEGKNRHYRWDDIRYAHWLDTAKASGMRDEMVSLIGELSAATPGVLASVEKQIPDGFPAAVSDSILKGLETAATRLELQRQTER